MRVAHVVRQFAPMRGGLEDSVFQLCRRLKERGRFDPYVVTLDRLFVDTQNKLAPSERIAGIEIRRLPWLGSRRYPLARGVLAAIEDANLVHVHAIDFFFDFLAWTRALHGKALVASTHGGFFHTQFAAPMKKAFFHVATRASARSYAAICASSENDFARFSEISPPGLLLVENGVDVEKWRDSCARSPERALISIGRWASNKRIERLFPLLAALRRLNPNWRLCIAGAPFDTSLAQLRQSASASGVESHVTFVEAPSDTTIRGLISDCRFIISASAYEGFGLSLIEGLSAGLCPIVSDIPPFIKVVKRLGFGVVASFRDPDADAAGIEQAFSALTDVQRQACIAFADGYAWPSVAARFERIYDAAIAQAQSEAKPRRAH